MLFKNWKLLFEIVYQTPPKYLTCMESIKSKLNLKIIQN